MTLSIDQAVCNSFKSQLLDANHDFSSAGGNVFKLALFQSNAVLNATTERTINALLEVVEPEDCGESGSNRYLLFAVNVDVAYSRA